VNLGLLGMDAGFRDRCSQEHPIEASDFLLVKKSLDRLRGRASIEEQEETVAEGLKPRRRIFAHNDITPFHQQGKPNPPEILNPR